MSRRDVATHLDRDAVSLRLWFRESYSPEYLSHPNHSAFHSKSLSSKRNAEWSDSPRYRWPTVTHSQQLLDNVYRMGCSVCGTKAIEGEELSLPNHLHCIPTKDASKLGDLDCGKWRNGEKCRLHRTRSDLPQTVSMLSKDYSQHSVTGSIETEEVKEEEHLKQTVANEVFLPSVPLTPLNYEDASSLKESVFHNALAEKVVKAEERQRVASRRTEYASRLKGLMQIVKADRAERMREDQGERTSDPGFPPLHSVSSSIPPTFPIPAEEKRETMCMTVPQSFCIHHSTVSNSRIKAKSEELTKVGGWKQLELSQKRLEEIKLNAKQRWERNSKKLRTREVKQETRNLDGEQQEVKRVKDPRVSSDQDHSRTPPQSFTAVRRSAVIGPTRLLSSSRTSVHTSDEENWPQTTMITPEILPILDMHEEPVPISPIPQVDYSAKKPQEKFLEPKLQSLEKEIERTYIVEGEDETENLEGRDVEPPTAAFAGTPPIASSRSPMTENPVIAPISGVPRLSIPAFHPIKFAQKEEEKEMITSGRQYTDASSLSSERSPIDSPEQSSRDKLSIFGSLLKDEKIKVEEPVPRRDDGELNAPDIDRSDSTGQSRAAVQGNPLLYENPVQVASPAASFEPQNGLKVAEIDVQAKRKTTDSRLQESDRSEQRAVFDVVHSDSIPSERQSGTDSNALSPEFGRMTFGTKQKTTAGDPYCSENFDEKPTAFDQSTMSQQCDSQSFYFRSEDLSYLSYEESLRIEEKGRKREEYHLAFCRKATEDKFAQTDETGCISVEVRCRQELLKVLRDRRVVSGLRLLGGFAEYLEIRGLHGF